MKTEGNALRQTVWVAAGAYIKAPVNFLANVALMRLIAPEHFGLMALALFFLTLSRKLFGFGFNHALIHRQKELDQAYPTHLFLHLLAGLLVVGLAWLFYPLVQDRYGADTATAFFALAIFGLSEAAGHSPRLLLEKKLSFGPLVRLDLWNLLFSNVLGIGLALAGCGWWALVGKQAAAWMIQTIGAWRLAPPLPGVWPTKTSALWFLSFGRPLWVAGLATLATLQLDDFLVGSLDSRQALGHYSRAYALACLPTTLVTHIVTRVAFPLYARLQEDRKALGRLFENILRFIVGATIPMGVLTAITAPEVIPFLFGERWTPMIPLLRLLLIFTCLRPIYDDCGQLFTALGRPEISSRILIHQALAVVLLCPPLTWAFGAQGAAVSVGLAMLLGVVEAYKKVPEHIPLRPWSILLPAAAIGLFAAAGTFAALFAAAPTGTLQVFLFKFLVFLFLYGMGMVLFQRTEIIRGIKLLRDEFF